MREVMTQTDKVERIINSACLYLGLSKTDLKKGKTKKHPAYHQKRLLIPILYENTNLSFQEIADRLGYNTHSNVIHHYRNVTEEVSDSVYGFRKTRVTYNELKQFCGL